MSDEGTSDLILEPEKKTLSSFLLPAALAAGAAALIYTKAKKSDKKSSGGSPSAGSNEVAFSSNYGSYTIGADYEQITLESYLAEQAEDGNLQIKGESSGLFASMEDTLMLNTRIQVLEAFKSTHKVKVGDERILIRDLPQDKTGVQSFNEWLETQTKKFQENY